MLRPQNFQLIGICNERPHHGSGSYSPVQHHRGPGLIPGLHTSPIVIIPLMLAVDSFIYFIHCAKLLA